uniref:Potassium voltage-gated channel protein eag 2 n=1 Tax=Cryptocotyle lingua TaxID=66766 RepID=A0A7U0TIE1_9TREM|nr:potassium voltage-gated channel protein eag 2 [Cryptocotyle lingua]
MFTTRRGLLAPQNTFLDTILRKCDGPLTCFLLANARILEFPIVYASSGFANQMGFNRIEVVQKPVLCTFLHGPQTSKDGVACVEMALKEQKAEQVELILYRKNLNAGWFLLRVIPIRNEQDQVILFLVTFRDVSAYRQPVEDDIAAHSALGAFAAASDPGSSWGRFARLVFSMVRQRTGSAGERTPEDSQLQTTLENPIGDKEVKCEVTAVTEAGEEPVETILLPSPHGKPGKYSHTQKSASTNESHWSLEDYPQSSKPDFPSSETKIRSAKKELRLSISDIPEASDAHLKRKRGLISKLLQPGRPVINSLSSDASSISSTNRKLNSSRHTGLNVDADDYAPSHWLTADAAPRYRLEPPCPPKHVLLHYSAFRVLWDWTILLLTGYTAVVVPLRLAIIPRPTWGRVPNEHVPMLKVNQLNVPDALAIADAVIDVIFCLDIVLNFHTSFVGAGGEVVAEPPIIRTNYLSGWFTLDLLSCLPYEVFKYIWPARNQSIHSMLDGLRIIRLLRIGRAARRIDQYLEYVSTLLLLMILCFFLLAHWFACAWYAVGILDLENKIQYGWIPRYFNDSLRPQNWDEFITADYFFPNVTFSHDYHQHYQSPENETLRIWSTNHSSGQTTLIRTTPILSDSKNGGTKKHVPLQNSVDKWSAYVTALYFSLSLLTTIGFGNVAAFTESEKLLSSVCMLIGALVYATIFGNITTIVQELYATRTRYNEIMKGVKDFLRIHEVPQELGERVIDYITSSWSVNKGIDTAKVLNYCPKDMQADISVHLNRCVFNSHPAFRLASDGCRRSLAVHFQTLHTAPGDLIFHQGESVEHLCFIASGSLEVLQDDEVIALLGKGDVFGDPCWRTTSSIPSAASVRALTYCTLHTIRLERLRAVLQFYHAFANSFTRNLEVNYNLCNRIIFRKLADVKREMELSMRMNKEPPLSSLPAGHPVRKLISRLRRPSQGLSTILSGESSLDGSDLESMSGCGQLETQRPRMSFANVARGFVPKGDTELATTNVPTTVPTALNSINERSLNPSAKSDSSTVAGVPATDNAASVGSALNPTTTQPNPARKWARLISKATNPRPQTSNTDSNEAAQQGSSATTDAITMVKATAVTTVADTHVPQSQVVPSPTQPQETMAASSNPTTVVVSDTVIKQLGDTIQKALGEIHKDLSIQLVDILGRINRLESQVDSMQHRSSDKERRRERPSKSDASHESLTKAPSVPQSTLSDPLQRKPQ